MLEHIQTDNKGQYIHHRRVCA